MTEREHKPYHERRVDQQLLDCAIRTEEVLLRIEGMLSPRAVTDRGNYEDHVTPETVVKPKGRRK